MKPAAERIQRAVDALRAAEDPVERLTAGHELRQLADQVEAESVIAARAAGVSWKRIGALYGTTKQGAQQRFGHLVRPAESSVTDSEEFLH